MICSEIAWDGISESIYLYQSLPTSTIIFRVKKKKKKNYYTRVIYGRPYSIPLCWTKVGERHELKVLMVQKTAEQMEMLNDGLSESHDVRRFMQLSAINIWSYIWAT
ncbi:unnamed protein product [Brassica oleracea]